jgi:tryptophanyl-tRNA synthetase
LYRNNKSNHKALKEALIEDLEKFIKPMRERRAEWEGKPEEVERIIAEGGKRMREIVHQKMLAVRDKVGLIHHE